MKDYRIKEKFIQLRANGLSYERIAEQLSVSKQTLINWGKQMAGEISNLRACRLESLQEQYCVAAEKRIQMFGDILDKICAELESRELRNTRTEKLLELLIKYAEALKRESRLSSFKSEAEIEQENRFNRVIGSL